MDSGEEGDGGEGRPCGVVGGVVNGNDDSASCSFWSEACEWLRRDRGRGKRRSDARTVNGDD